MAASRRHYRLHHGIEVLPEASISARHPTCMDLRCDIPTARELNRWGKTCVFDLLVLASRVFNSGRVLTFKCFTSHIYLAFQRITRSSTMNLITHYNAVRCRNQNIDTDRTTRIMPAAVAFVLLLPPKPRLRPSFPHQMADHQPHRQTPGDRRLLRLRLHPSRIPHPLVS